MHLIDPVTLKNWIDADEAIVIDVREPGEFASERIFGAQLIPLAAINVAKLPANKGKKIVLHCHAGKRGETACAKLLAEDPELELYHLQGGIAAWIKAGLAVQTSGRKILPLGQQVQITLGLLVLLASMLTYYINPLFVCVSAFLGCGLIFAGLSGFCGLAKLLALLPWNKG